jgi:uncharacterized membrane protein YciS (DUF1049 family)
MILAGLILLGLIIICGFFYLKGKDKAKLNQAEKDLEAVENAKKVSDDIDKLDDVSVAERLSKWTR